VAGQLMLPQPARASGAAQPAEPNRIDEAKGRLLARLRVARGDHAQWQRVLKLEHRAEQQGTIGQLVEQAAAEVRRIEAELVDLEGGTGGQSA
jgi:hypothetical protein